MILIFILFIVCIFFIFGTSVYVSTFYKEFEEKIKEPSYLQIVLINIVLGFSIFLICLYYSNIYSKIGYPSFKNIITALLLLDAFYYWTHYLEHYIPDLYNITHNQHHKSIDLIPIDAFHSDHIENIMYSIVFCAFPLLILENVYEYVFVTSIFYLHTMYLHSNLKNDFFLPFLNNTEYHNLHHTIGKGNYALYFPFWDDYMKTRLNNIYMKEAEVKEDKESKETMTMEEFVEACKKKKLTIINNFVINCDTWIKDHPGGSGVIEGLIGKDSSESFNTMHNDSNFANEMIKKLTIAKISPVAVKE
jgi:sterol desaturase/sphingolipid hydroxylase (fatty acid hydroxylase superfamily)